MTKLEEGVMKKVKKFFKKHGNKGKFEKASVRAMQAPTVSGWANRQKRINALKEEEFNSEDFIDFLLSEGHSEEAIEQFLDEDFEQFLEEVVQEGVIGKTIATAKLAHRKSKLNKSAKEHAEIADKFDNIDWRVKTGRKLSLGDSLLSLTASSKLMSSKTVSDLAKEKSNLSANQAKGSDLKTGKLKAKNLFGKKSLPEEAELSEENLMEIKMKLKPGRKMSSKQFAKMKADVLVKQKEKAEKKAAPKPEPKPEVIETDDNNRNARLLKGQFPWGKVTPELANAALSRLKAIQKPSDRLSAMNAIWDKQEHFHSLVKTGKVNVVAKKEERSKSKISLAKVRGVD